MNWKICFIFLTEFAFKEIPNHIHWVSGKRYSFFSMKSVTFVWNWFFLYPIEAIHVFCRHDVIKASKALRMRKIKIMNTQAKYLKFTKYRYYRCFHPHVAGFFVKNIGKLYAYDFLPILLKFYWLTSKFFSRLYLS